MEKWLEERKKELDTVGRTAQGHERSAYLGHEIGITEALSELRRRTVAVGKITMHPHMIHLDTGEVELNEGKRIRIILEEE